jgi:hypothetical protein
MFESQVLLTTFKPAKVHLRIDPMSNLSPTPLNVQTCVVSDILVH